MPASIGQAWREAGLRKKGGALTRFSLFASTGLL
jgi:hypothetical protein